jgi:hypothetical protein
MQPVLHVFLFTYIYEYETSAHTIDGFDNPIWVIGRFHHLDRPSSHIAPEA